MPSRHVSGTRAGKKERNTVPSLPVLSSQGAVLLTACLKQFECNEQPPCSSHHLMSSFQNKTRWEKIWEIVLLAKPAL